MTQGQEQKLKGNSHSLANSNNIDANIVSLIIHRSIVEHASRTSSLTARRTKPKPATTWITISMCITAHCVTSNRTDSCFLMKKLFTFLNTTSAQQRIQNLSQKIRKCLHCRKRKYLQHFATHPLISILSVRLDGWRYQRSIQGSRAYSQLQKSPHKQYDQRKSRENEAKTCSC